MFNPDLKNAFLDMQKTEKTKSTIRTLFNKTEPYEVERGDLYTWDAATIVILFRSMGFTTVGTARTYLTFARKYFDYCFQIGLSNNNQACLVSERDIVDAASYKNVYVSSPEDLMKYLDAAFPSDISEDTRVKIYKTYYWLAFSGVPSQDVMSVTPKTIQGDTITVNSRQYIIHESAIPLVMELCEIAEEDTPLMKICSKKINTLNIGDYILGLMNPDGRRLLYKNVYKSGLFYRIHEQEKQGFPVRFDAQIELQIQLTGYEGHGRSLAKRKNTLRSTLLKDYNAWKTAFGL